MVKILGNTDLSSNQLQFHVVHKGTSFPSSPAPVQGQLFFRTDENKLYFYDGSDWTAVGTGAGGGGVGTYLHTQSSPSTTWNVTHNLNDTRPVLEIYDNDGVAIEPVSITITDANSLVIEFGSEVAGTARVHGGVFAGGTGTGHFLPNANNTWDIGSETLKWKDLHLGGKAYIDGGIDPSYIQLDPQASEPDSGLNNKLWIDSSDSNKLKFKDNSGTNRYIAHSGNLGTGLIQSAGTFSVDVGTTANKIVQLDSSGKLPSVDGSQLINIGKTYTSLIKNTYSTTTPGVIYQKDSTLSYTTFKASVKPTTTSNIYLFGGNNYLKNITPTIAGNWVVDPTDLTNTTDENRETETNYFMSDKTTDDTTYFQWDMGSTRTGNLIVYATVRSTEDIGIAYCKVKISTDGSNWTTLDTFSAGTSEVTISKIYENKTFRYLRMTYYANASGIKCRGYVKEVSLFQNGTSLLSATANTWNVLTLTPSTIDVKTIALAVIGTTSSGSFLAHFYGES